MPALDAKDYAEFTRMLEELAPEVNSMKETPQSFMRDMIEKQNLYGERVFVSPKQLNWIKQLHEEYIGDTAHEKDTHDPGPGKRDSDMDDDIPF